MVDLFKKKHFFIDLDDTLINTSDSKMLGLKRAYFQLAYESKTDITALLSYETFEKAVFDIYDKKDSIDYTADVFEDFCRTLASKYKINPGCSTDALSAKLYWYFKQTRYNTLMPLDGTFDLLSYLRDKKCSLFCVTRGSCNFQHTKLLLTNLNEDLFDRLIIVPSTDRKVNYLRKEIEVHGLVREQTIFVSDSIDDVVDAHDAGIDVIRIFQGDHKKEVAAENTKEKADLDVDSLRELLQKLKENENKIDKNV
jgi:FMN phosphatase YigB (HAD superfamily)